MIDQIANALFESAKKLGFMIEFSEELQNSYESTLRKHSIDPVQYPIRVFLLAWQPHFGYSFPSMPLDEVLEALQQLADALIVDKPEFRYYAHLVELSLSVRIARMMVTNPDSGIIVAGMAYDAVVGFSRPPTPKAA